MWIWPLGMGKILKEPIRRRAHRIKEFSGGLCRVGNQFLECTPPPKSDQLAIFNCPFPHQRWHKSITVFHGLLYYYLITQGGLNILNLSIIYGIIHTYTSIIYGIGHKLWGGGAEVVSRCPNSFLCAERQNAAQSGKRFIPNISPEFREY